MNKRFKWYDADRGWMAREEDENGAFVEVRQMANKADATKWVNEARSTRHSHPDNPEVGVRVWYGREFVEGPDCRMRGWFWCVYDATGEGDVSGPYNGKTGKQEATEDALGVLPDLWPDVFAKQEG